jgi:dienelactone hydrolase
MPRILETVNDRIESLRPHWRLIMPAGPPPYGLVIQMHGCGGNGPFQIGYGEAAAAVGTAALIVDSYPHRAISEAQAYGLVCAGLKLWGRERGGDLFAAFVWAKAQPTIDPKRIFAAGWSHGGWSLLDALAVATPQERARWTGLCDLAPEPLEGLAGVFAVYPYFGVASVARGRGLRFAGPMTAIAGTADTVVGGRSLVRALRAAPKPGAVMDITVLEGATHSFDEPEAKDPRFVFDPALAKGVQAQFAAFVGTRGGV